MNNLKTVIDYSVVCKHFYNIVCTENEHGRIKSTSKSKFTFKFEQSMLRQFFYLPSPQICYLLF